MWSILKSAVEGYIAHGALSRGAAIAFYVVTSLAPVLLIVVAVAGIVFGQDAVRGGLVQQLSGLFGQQGGELIQTMLASSSDKTSGATASVLGAIMVLVTASGVFSEMQTGLNQAWQVKAPDQPVLLMLRARAASLGLVAALGFLLMVSLAASAALSALGTYLGGRTAFAPLLLAALNTLISLGLFTLLFAAIYKVLPDTPIELARGRHRRSDHRRAVYGRQVSHWLVSRHDGRQFGLWGSRRACPHSAMGVLLRADLPVRRRAHPSYRGPSGRAGEYA